MFKNIVSFQYCPLQKHAPLCLKHSLLTPVSLRPPSRKAQSVTRVAENTAVTTATMPSVLQKKFVLQLKTQHLFHMAIPLTKLFPIGACQITILPKALPG